MRRIIPRRLMTAVGIGVLALGLVVWIAVTANGIGAGLVITDIALSPVIGLAIGTAVAVFTLELFIAVVMGDDGVPSGRQATRVLIATALATVVATPLATVELWKMHAHRSESAAIEQFAEAYLVVLGAGLVSWLVSRLGLSRRVTLNND